MLMEILFYKFLKKYKSFHKRFLLYPPSCRWQNRTDSIVVVWLDKKKIVTSSFDNYKRK